MWPTNQSFAVFPFRVILTVHDNSHCQPDIVKRCLLLMTSSARRTQWSQKRVACCRPSIQSDTELYPILINSSWDIHSLKRRWASATRVSCTTVVDSKLRVFMRLVRHDDVFLCSHSDFDISVRIGPIIRGTL